MVDASVLVDLLLDRGPQYRAGSISALLADTPIAAPHLVDAEVGHALRRAVLRGTLPSALARAALEDLGLLDLQRHPHTALLPRAFELRDNATIYDALYLALAELLDVSLLTRDAALARVPGIAVPVEVLG